MVHMEEGGTPDISEEVASSFQGILHQLRHDLSDIAQCELGEPVPLGYASAAPVIDDCEAIVARAVAISQQIQVTVEANRARIEQAIQTFLRWMKCGTIVRVVGAGRARLAASIPANRLAHGGARVFVINDISPLPHSIRGGAILAASASGRSEEVVKMMRDARRRTHDIEIVGIAKSEPTEFARLCDIFIGIQPEVSEATNPLRALADNEEYIISDMLDAMVVAAGRRGGFVETVWKIGHENLGPTGPYDLPGVHERMPGTR